MGSGSSKEIISSVGDNEGSKNRTRSNDSVKISSTTASEKTTINIDASVPSQLTSNNLSDKTKSEGAGESIVGESKCPMHQKDGTYSYDWLALFRKDFPHGPGGRKQLSEEEARTKLHRRISVLDNNMAAPGGGCPVQHREYNVYGQPIDPANNMPSNPNQLPAPQQNKELSTHRVTSSIPKGGASEEITWTYPSPQMFYNALARKGKLGDTREHEIDSVVALHNNMNEKTWRKVLEWEQMTAGTNNNKPKLLKFMGRPKDLSPKAWLKYNLFSHPLPFDRHDWTILRQDGTTVRYVIDYYFDESLAKEDTGGMPEPHDHHATPSLLVDVRPALDGPLPLWNRVVTMPLSRWSTHSYQYLPLWPSPDMKRQVQESVQVWKSIRQQQPPPPSNGDTAYGDDNDANLSVDFARAVKECRAAQARVDQSSTDDECTKASLDLTICMSKFLCPLQHSSFTKVLMASDKNEHDIQHSLERLGECVMLKTSRHHEIQQKSKEI